MNLRSVISWLAEELLASEKKFCSVELVNGIDCHPEV
jgi:hypothetical protein